MVEICLPHRCDVFTLLERAHIGKSKKTTKGKKAVEQSGGDFEIDEIIEPAAKVSTPFFVRTK